MNIIKVHEGEEFRFELPCLAFEELERSPKADSSPCL